ncbi:MAG: deoxyribose-phosphate aldolase [Bdellovibrionaceae bacterium]|nr:deoxyribose-phosphate aldolase [Pseudobdellovibrionaceae bacterium]
MNTIQAKKASSQEIASKIDHTLLKPEASQKQILNLCREAIDYGFYSVCIPPCFVKRAVTFFKTTKPTPVNPPKICTVIGFPLGYNSTKIKVAETLQALNDGAVEIDMVINISALKNQEFQYVEEEIKNILSVLEKHNKDNVLKVIIETALLTEQEITQATKIIQNTKAHYIKTSTGFSTRGACIEDIKIIKAARAYDKSRLRIKASGGIKSFTQAKEYLKMGVDRLGLSSGVEIIKEISQ